MNTSQKVSRIRQMATWQIQRTENNLYVGVCDPLRLTVQADTWNELQELIEETMEVLIEDLHESDELDQFLVEHDLNDDNTSGVASESEISFLSEWVGA